MHPPQEPPPGGCSELPGSRNPLPQDEDCLGRIKQHYRAEGTFIGNGQYGSVIKLRDFKTKQMIAVKVIPYEIEDGRFYAPEIITQEANKEISISCRLNRLSSKTPVFIHTFGWLVCQEPPVEWTRTKGFQTATYGEQAILSYLFIFMDYASTTLKSGDVYLDDIDKKKMIYILLHGLYVAWNAFEFNHNDLHSGNIMIDVNDNDDEDITIGWGPVTIHNPRRLMPRIIDFGRSTIKRGKYRDDMAVLLGQFGMDNVRYESFPDNPKYQILRFLMSSFFDDIRKNPKEARRKKPRVDTRVCDVYRVEPAITMWETAGWMGFCGEYCASKVRGLVPLV